MVIDGRVRAEATDHECGGCKCCEDGFSPWFEQN
jgi:hypothetical protein